MADLWQLGLALGLAIDAGLVLALALSGVGLTVYNLPRFFAVGVSVATLGTTCLPLAVSLFRFAVSAYVRWDEWQHRNDAPPAAPAIPQPIVFTLPPVDTKRQAKELSVETFFRAGEKAGGFSEGKLAGCVGSDHGPWLRHFYMSPAGGEWLRDAGGNVGTVWNFERNLDGLLLALRGGELPLPPGPVPDVKPLPDSAAQRRAPQKSAAQAKHVIVEQKSV